jgi:anti-sigma B factor antagonist
MIAALSISKEHLIMIDTIKEENGNLYAALNLAEANLGNADEFKAELTGLLNQHHKKILLNMEQVKYIDSSFLGALVAALKHALSLKLDIALVGLQQDVHDLLKLIRLDKVFKIFGTYEDAVKTD